VSPRATTETLDQDGRVRRGRYHVLPKRELDVDVWQAALDRVDRAYDLFDHLCVSFSGGKDSTIVLHAALEVAAARDRLPVRAVFWDEEAIPHQTAEYVERVAARDDIELEWLCLPVRHRNACTSGEGWWYPFDPDVPEDRWVRPAPRDRPGGIVERMDGFHVQPPSARWSIPEMNGLLFGPEHGRATLLMGIRAAESLLRHQAVTRRAVENWIIPLSRSTCPTLRQPVSKIYPCYDWSNEDVWTAPRMFGWDHNQAYDVLEMAGLPRMDQWCAPPFGEEPARALWTFRTCFPELWEKMHDRVPGAATAARYSCTSLYAFGGAPPKPAELTWEDWIAELIGRRPEGERAAVAAIVRRWVREHYSKTAEPILAESRHPESGVSWRELARMATRGNLKQRNQLLPGREPRQAARMRAAYDDELARARAEGAMT